MDVHYFLNARLDFIRSFYRTAVQPFIEIKRKIEESEPPYIPPYSEDGEPPFLLEWLEAEESIQVLGYMCVSILSASLKLYFQIWKNELGFSIDDELRKTFKKEGWLHGYSSCFLKHYFKSPFRGFRGLMLQVILLKWPPLVPPKGWKPFPGNKVNSHQQREAFLEMRVRMW